MPSSYFRKILAAIQEHSNEYIFRNIKFNKISGEHKLCTGKHMSYTRAREILLKNIAAIGLDSKNYGLHSFRSGGATSAANSGVIDRLFKKHGRWKSDNAKDKYVRESDVIRRSVTLQLGI